MKTSRLVTAIFLSLSSLLGYGQTSTLESQDLPNNVDQRVNGIDVEIEEVVVVGQVLFQDQINSLKTPTPIIDVPQSVFVMSGYEIETRGFTSVGDLANHIPGLTTSQGEGHRDSVVFRGVRSTADFFIDGVRDDVQYYRPLYNLEQIEVLKGPNALLFGRGGTGGVLNRVTKKGVLGERFTNLGASVNSFGSALLRLDSNVDLGSDAALRMNAYYEALDNHRDFFDGDRLGLNPTAKIQVSEETTLDLYYEYLDHEQFVDRGIPTGVDGRPISALAKTTFADPELNTTELTAHLYKAMLQHRFSRAVKGNLSLFYGDYDKGYQNFYPVAYDQTAGEVTLDGYVDTTQRQNLQLSGNLVAEFDSGSITHTTLLGFELMDTDSDQDRYNAQFDTSASDREVFSVQPSIPLTLAGGVGVNRAGQTTTSDFTQDLNDDTRVDIDVRSLYVQDEIRLSSYVMLVLGGRYDEFDIRVHDVKSGQTRGRKDSQFSPRLGLILKPQENLSVYASYSESFLPRSGEQFADISGDNNRLDPNTFANLELGVKWDLSQRLAFSAAVFEIEKSSPQVADNDPATLDVVDSTTQGFEAQMSGELNDAWTVTASYGYLDGEQVDRLGDTGLRPRELPKHTLSLWSTYQLSARWGLGLGASYQDESFIDNANTATLPSYTRVDAAVYFDVSDNWSLQLNVNNALDKRYFPNAHARHQVTVAEPLNARLSVQWMPR
jgi:catecholate siderophore receptor